jgi:hypothetical protein
MTTEEENKRLRYWLWLRHGHEGLYGDDGGDAVRFVPVGLPEMFG